MTAPTLFAGCRGRLFAQLIALVVVQAAALAATALATRSAFSGLNDHGMVSLSTLALLVGSACVTAAAEFLFRVRAEELGQDYAKDIRLTLFDHASRSAPSALARRRKGYQMLRFVGDLTALKDWPGLALPRLIQAFVLLPSAIWVLYYLEPVYGWVGLGLVALSLVALVFGHRPLWQTHTLVRSRRALLAAEMSERMPVAPQLAAMQRRSVEQRGLSKKAIDLASAARSRRAVFESLKAAPDIAAGFAAAIILAVGAHNDLATGTIAGALAALGLTLRPLRNVMAMTNRAAAFRVAHGKLAAALARPTVDVSTGDHKLNEGPIAITLDLPDVTPLSVPRGGFAKLSYDHMERIIPFLTGVEPVRDGQISLNGHDLSAIRRSSLNQRVAVVSDNPLVLRGTLRRALTLGLRRRPSDDVICKTLEKAGFADIVVSLGGLGRRLNEGAADLTPSQRLTLSIMRAVLMNPGLVLVRDHFEQNALTGELSTLHATCIQAV